MPQLSTIAASAYRRNVPGVPIIALVTVPAPSAATWLDGEFTIAPEHPALPGHFPGNPIVPGVVVLQRVLSLLAAHTEAEGAVTIVDAKFLRPLYPGEVCTVAIRRPQQRRSAFECRVRSELVVRGSLSLAAET